MDEVFFLFGLGYHWLPLIFIGWYYCPLYNDNNRKIYIVFMLVYCMTIEDSVSGFGGKVKDFGSRVYDTSKDVVKSATYAAIGLAVVGAVGAVNPNVARGDNLGESLVKEFLYQGARSAAKNEFEDKGTNVVVNNGAFNIDGTSRSILNELNNIRFAMPLGDTDGDGDLDWMYNDGNHVRYDAKSTFGNEGCNFFNREKGFHVEKCFTYSNGGKDISVPKDTNILWYADPALNLSR